MRDDNIEIIAPKSTGAQPNRLLPEEARRNTEPYRNAIRDMADFLQIKGVRIVGNDLEFDTRFRDALNAGIKVQNLFLPLIGNIALRESIKIRPSYAQVDFSSNTTHTGTAFDSAAHTFRFTFGENFKAEMSDAITLSRWKSCVEDIQTYLEKEGKKADITVLSESEMEQRRAKHALVKALAKYANTPGLRVRGNVIEMDIHSDEAFEALSNIKSALKGIAKHEKHKPTDSTSISVPAPSIAQKRQFGGAYFSDERYVTQITVGRFSKELRDTWRESLEIAKLRAAKKGITLQYEDAPDVATDPKGAGCLGLINPMYWIKRGRMGGSGELTR